MGADLIGVALVIDNDKAPDWKSAERWARGLDTQQLLGDEMERAMEQFDPSLEDTSEMNPKELSEYAGQRRQSLLGAIELARDAYENSWRNTMSINARGATVWVLAETSWGDSPEGFDEMWLFIESGAAKAAGFDG